MTLLDPVAAMVTAALASPLLVLLYFLKLRRRRVRVGSTLLWQRAVRDLQVNEPFRWLRPSLLLFLQLVALACFAIAIGRPTIPGGAVTGDRVIILLDRSASMSTLDGPAGATRFEEAIRTAEDIINKLNSGTSVQVISFASQPDIRFSQSTNHAAAQRALTQITPTDQPGDIEPALRLAQTLLRSERGEDTSDESSSVVLISDGGFARSNFAFAGADVEFRRVGPPEADSYDNLGITHFNISTDFDDPSISRAFVRVQNAANREVAATLTLDSAAGMIDRQPIRLPASTEAGPGTQTHTFEFNRSVAGLLSVSIDREDLLPTDNSVSAIIYPAALPEIVLVTPDNDDGSLDWVIRNTLEELDLAALTVLDSTTFNNLLESGRLGRVDLVVFDRVDVPSSVPAPSISFAGSLPGLAVLTDNEQADRFTSWSRSHPVMRRLVLDNVRMSRRAWFDTTSTDQLVDELAAGRLGPSIVQLSESGRRRLGIAFNPADSNWPLDIAFPLFLIQAVENYTLGTNSHRDAFATTSSNATVAVSNGSGTLELEGPVSLTAKIPAEQSDGTRRVSLGIPERAGVYSDERANAALAVNMLLSGESAVATSDTISIAGRVLSTDRSTEGRREVWHWFVLAAIVLLTAEWFWFAWRMRT